MKKIDVIIIGGGAAGLMCAIEAGKRGRKVIVLDHANKVGKKILMSGGGNCNFTNYYISPDKYISHNPHFCKSALSRYTQWDFISLVEKYQISYHEKTLGQLFCDNKSKAILDMLLNECHKVHANIYLETNIDSIEKMIDQNFDQNLDQNIEQNNSYRNDHHFRVNTNRGDFLCESLVIATGGLSIPTMGASPLGYKIAEQFGLKIWPTRAGLVPFTLQPPDKDKLSNLSGISLAAIVKNDRQTFSENILFTHRGLSGPAILQISSYWLAGEEIIINMLPEIEMNEYLKLAQQQYPQRQLGSILKNLLPKRLVEVFFNENIITRILQSCTQSELLQIAGLLNSWSIKPNGTEGYRTAEVTLGGVDCDALSSKTFEVKTVPGLYFIGEVLDVTGWLGGYNFQWAWSSGWAAGQVV